MQYAGKCNYTCHMRLKSLILPGLLIGVLYFASAVKDTIGKLNFKLKGLKLHTFDTSTFTNPKIVFSVSVDVKNGGDVSGTINSFILDFFYNGKLIGSAEKKDAFQVTAHAGVNINAMVSLPALSLFGSIKQAYVAFAMKQKIVLNVKGRVSTNYGELTLNETLPVV